MEFYIKSYEAFPFMSSIYFRDEESPPNAESNLSSENAIPMDNVHCCVYLRILFRANETHNSRQICWMRVSNDNITFLNKPKKL